NRAPLVQNRARVARHRALAEAARDTESWDRVLAASHSCDQRLIRTDARSLEREKLGQHVCAWRMPALPNDQCLEEFLGACVSVELDRSRRGICRRHGQLCGPIILLGAFDPHAQAFARRFAYTSGPGRTLRHRARRMEKHSFPSYKPIEEARVGLAALIVRYGSDQNVGSE